ncbi:MAG: precorrin-8X methylmutase [Lachnospiraceae bacterium]|nr:precorrin-8X methylmutase [Lachnospiraceae bacterium]
METSGLLKIEPSEIERESFRIITENLNEMGIVLPEENASVIKRVIHTTADFSFAETMEFSLDAVRICQELIQNAATIVTDTNMTLAGINKKRLERFGVKIKCFMADEDVAREAKKRDITRAAISVERAALIGGPVIYSVGNAPTALMELNDLYLRGEFEPAFIIGVPVGFVNVEYSKELFRNSKIPHIINYGRKGGSNVAAAIINAIVLGIE